MRITRQLIEVQTDKLIKMCTLQNHGASGSQFSMRKSTSAAQDVTARWQKNTPAAQYQERSVVY